MLDEKHRINESTRSNYGSTLAEQDSKENKHENVDDTEQRHGKKNNSLSGFKKFSLALFIIAVIETGIRFIPDSGNNSASTAKALLAWLLPLFAGVTFLIFKLASEPSDSLSQPSDFKNRTPAPPLPKNLLKLIDNPQRPDPHVREWIKFFDKNNADSKHHSDKGDIETGLTVSAAAAGPPLGELPLM